MEAPITFAAPQMRPDSAHLVRIAGRDAAGLTNAGMEALSTIAATTQMIGTSQMTGSISHTEITGGSMVNSIITDSMTTRNGKGMGSGSGRPLPSTHLEKRVSDHMRRDVRFNYSKRMMGIWTMEHRRRMGPGIRTGSWMGTLTRQRFRMGARMLNAMMGLGIRMEIAREMRRWIRIRMMR